MDNGASRLVTKSFLASLKKVYKPKIAISENVCTGNIGRRVVENVKDVMQSKVIFTQPSDVGFGCVARRRSFTILLRHDSGRFILDPQDTYDKLCAGLNDSQLSLHDLLACTTEADVLRELPEGYKLSPFEQSNLDQYQDLLDGKGVPIPNQVFAVNQNPNKVFKAAMAGILPAFTATDKCLWSRGNRRPILAYEKFLGHGWPMTQELCQALKIPVFSMDGLSNAHQSVGNGQHLVCAALALLPTLASVELFPEASPSMVPSDYHNVEINPQANGRCLFSCIYLHFASDSEKAEWSKVDRNAQGFPSDADRLREEDTLVKNFMLKSFADGVAAHPEWEGELKLLEQVFLTCTMPEDKEIELMSQLFNLQLMITYDASAQPVGRVGHASWPKVMLSNAPVFDGAGESAAHFRYVWTCPTQADPVQEVKEEFPDLEIHSDSVKVDAFGYQATWKVGPDAANLMEAATMAQRVLRAGTAQFRKLESLKRSDLQAVCVKACLKKQGNMSDMKNRLVYNFLKHATAEQIVNAESTEICAVSEKPAVDKEPKPSNPKKSVDKVQESKPSTGATMVEGADQVGEEPGPTKGKESSPKVPGPTASSANESKVEGANQIGEDGHAGHQPFAEHLPEATAAPAAESEPAKTAEVPEAEPEDCSKRLEAAEMFPKVKVNRRTVSINVHTFTKKFKVATDQSVMEVAALANKYVLAGNEIWAVLNTLTKKDLQAECEKEMLNKRETNQELREILLRKQLSRFKVGEDSSSAAAVMEDAPDLKAHSPQAAPQASIAASFPAKDQSEEGAQAAEGQDPQEAEGAEQGTGLDGGGKSQVTLFGRSTFAMDFNQDDDKTVFFDKVDGPEPVEPESKVSTMDLIQAGEHGVVPVAALVKIMQGFAETQRGGNHLAVLLAGGQKWKKEKLERQVVKRVIMGPKDLFTATIIEDELAVDKSLSVWGVLLETGNPVEPLAFIEEFMGKDGVQPLIGYIRMGAATNLTKPESWTDPEVLNFGSADVNAQGDWGEGFCHRERQVVYACAGLQIFAR